MKHFIVNDLKFVHVKSVRVGIMLNSSLFKIYFMVEKNKVKRNEALFVRIEAYDDDFDYVVVHSQCENRKIHHENELNDKQLQRYAEYAYKKLYK